MGGLSFTIDGKDHDIYMKRGYPVFEDDEEEEAFKKWRKTNDGIACCGPVPQDWSEEHYLNDQYPFDEEELERHIDIEDEDECDEKPYIDWCSYDKSRDEWESDGASPPSPFGFF